MLEQIAEYAQQFGDRMGLVVEDLQTGERIAHNEHARYSSASLIKYPIMWTFFRQVAEGKQDLNTIHILHHEDKAGSSPFDSSILREFHDGLAVTLEDCVKIMIVISDDTATNIIMNRLGMPYMNAALQEIGLLDTTVGRLMMDYEGLEAGRDNFVSAHDINKLSLMLCRNEVLPEKYCQQMLSILLNQRKSDSLCRFLPMAQRVAHKGGCIRQYQMDHDCGVFYENGKPRLSVNVLTRYVPDSKEVIGTVGKMAYSLLTQVDSF